MPRVSKKVVKTRTERAKARLRNPVELPRARVSFERMSRIVAAEMEAVKKKLEVNRNKSMPEARDHWSFTFFNNFRRYLPGNDLRQVKSALNEPLRYSRSGKTVGQLVAEVDLIIERLGIDPGKLAELDSSRAAERLGFPPPIERTRVHSDKLDVITVKQFEMALPIYIELRRRGYSHHTLVG
jgi:hypothetical protein